jgi:hypothetical protein
MQLGRVLDRSGLRLLMPGCRYVIRNRQPKAKLKINHEHILLKVQRAHILRSRA